MIEASLGLIAVAAAALAAAGVPALWAWRRAGRETQELLGLLREELPPLCRELRLTTRHIEALTVRVDEELGRLRHVTTAMGAGGAVPGWGALVWKSMMMSAGLRAAAAAFQWWRRGAPHRPTTEVRNGQ